MTLALLLLLAGTQPEPTHTVRSVELIEYNRYYCGADGSGGTEQVIYWDRGWDGERHVKHWRPCNGEKDYVNNGLGHGFSEWRTVNGRTFEIRAFSVIETWSTCDPEMQDRTKGTEWRRDLFK